MFLHFSPEVVTFRGFSNGDEHSYPERKSPDLNGLIKFMDGDTAHISNTTGVITFAARTQLFNYLRSLGVKCVHWEHKRKKRVYTL